MFRGPLGTSLILHSATSYFRGAAILQGVAILHGVAILYGVQPMSVLIESGGVELDNLCMRVKLEVGSVSGLAGRIV